MQAFYHFIKSESKELKLPLIVMAVFAGIVNGLAVSVAVRTVNLLSPGTINFELFIQFAACLIAFWFSKKHVLNRTTVIVESIIENCRIRILRKLRNTDLLKFEGMDTGKIFSTLSTDAMTISVASAAIINAGSSVVMMAFVVVYIGILSIEALAITAVLFFLTVFYYLQKSQHVTEQLALSAKLENEFFDNLNGLLSGFKDFKLSRAKADDFFDNELKTVVSQTANLRVKAGKSMNTAVIIGQTFLFITIAGLLFILPNIKPDDIKIIAMLVPVVLFLAGPIGDVVAAVPALAKAQASIDNIQNLEKTIDDNNKNIELSAERSSLVKSEFQSLVAKDLEFSYPPNGVRPFSIKPFNFEIKKGELVFLVGGNGSGKSTFLKLITGLYHPASGELLYDGAPVDAENIAQFRNLFSTIFTDFHIFKRTLGVNTDDKERIDGLIKKFELTGKTDIVRNEVTNRKLSTGQRKRLALILATLEDKPFYIFDEWAADQDPVFRKYFYTEILQELKQAGKTVLAVTHDDHYFHLADRVLQMQYGSLSDYNPS